MPRIEKRTPFTVRLAAKHLKVLGRLARAQGVTRNEALRRLIIEAGGKRNAHHR